MLNWTESKKRSVCSRLSDDSNTDRTMPVIAANAMMPSMACIIFISLTGGLRHLESLGGLHPIKAAHWKKELLKGLTDQISPIVSSAVMGQGFSKNIEKRARLSGPVRDDSQEADHKALMDET